MPNRYRSQRRKPRRLSTVEFYGALIWLAQAGGSLAFRTESRKTFCDLSYIWSTVGLIVMAVYNIEHANRLLSAHRNANNQSYVVACMIGLFIVAFGLTWFGLYFCDGIQEKAAMVDREITASQLAPLIIWVLFELCVFYGPGLEAFKQTLLISGWFLIACLAAILFSYGMVLPAGLYAAVALLWTFNYLLKFDLI